RHRARGAAGAPPAHARRRSRRVHAIGLPLGGRRGRLERDRRGIVRRSRGRPDSRHAAADRRAPPAGRQRRGARRDEPAPGPRGARDRSWHRSGVGPDMIRNVKGVALVAILTVLAGCGTLRIKEQRTTQGPLAEDLFTTVVYMANGREPNFDERRHWENQLDYRISQYLHAHPGAASSQDVMTFLFMKQAAVGQTNEQVLILLGPPLARTTQEDEMEKLARRYWPYIKGNAAEPWVYPDGWNLYFRDSTLVDITQYLVP